MSSRRITSIFICLSFFSLVSFAQDKKIAGTVHYSLPVTAFSIKVNVETDIFVAGPYAKYASRYFDTPAIIEDGSLCKITSIDIIPSIEADHSQFHSVTLKPNKGVSDMFFRLMSSGLVCVGDGFGEAASSFSYSNFDNPFAGKGLDKMSKEVTSISFKIVQDEDGSHDVPVKQTKNVDLTEAQKAEELANAIIELKQEKINIITGNTDAEFPGEAMGAVLNEINSVVEDYFTMFYGISRKTTQQGFFSIVPEGSGEYILFKISDESGILPPEAQDGRPITMTIECEEVKLPELGHSFLRKGSVITYRIPSTSVVRVTDGDEVLLEMRVPIYQAGVEAAVVL